MTTFDIDSLMRVLAEGLPRLGFPGCALALYDEPQQPTGDVRCLLAYNHQGELKLSSDATRFPARQLVPRGFLSREKPAHLVVKSLYFQDHQIGVIVFQQGPRDGRMYEILRGQISSALQGALLVQQVRQHSAELARKQYILDTFMANVPDAIYFKDRDSRIIQTNQAHASRFGLNDPVDMIGKTDFDLFPEEQARPKYEVEQQIMRTGQPVLNLKEPGTGICWLLTTKMPLRDEHGHIIGTFGISRDITALKQTEEALEKAKEASEAANQAKSDFLARMSHELRTPLNTILGFAQLSVRHPGLSPELQENLTIINRSGEHLLTLINQVLDLAKIEAGKITLDERTFDLYALLDGVVDLFRLRARQKGLQLRFDCGRDVPRYVRTDEIKLRQVLINLLNNAIKFTEEGNVTLKIERLSPVQRQIEKLNIENERKAEDLRQSSIFNLQFSIQDTGPGIAREEIDKLFEAFSQTDIGRQTQEGTGLGLSISRKFVQLMGSDITITSELEKGSSFTFEIQVGLVEQSTIDKQRSATLKRAIALEPGQPQYRLLIVDDKPDNRKLLVKLLSNFSSPNFSSPLSGFELQEAVNGQEAIEIWKTWKPHLIWMDIRMPVMGGYEATKRIRALPNGNDTKIIVLSASAFEEERTIALSQGCDDFLRKPFQEAEIFALLAKHLGVRFVYEEEQQVAGRRSQVTGEEVLTPEALAALPEELRTELELAADVVDLDAAYSLIDQIRPHNPPLAEALAELVHKYRFDVLQTLFAQIKQTLP